MLFIYCIPLYVHIFNKLRFQRTFKHKTFMAMYVLNKTIGIVLYTPQEKRRIKCYFYIAILFMYTF